MQNQHASLPRRSLPQANGDTHAERRDLTEYYLEVLTHRTLSQQFRLQTKLNGDQGIKIDSFVRLLADAIQDVAEAHRVERQNGILTVLDTARSRSEFPFDDPILDNVDALYGLKCEIFMSFSAIDMDGNGFITWEDFIDFVVDTQAANTVASEDLDAGNQRSFVLLDQVPYSSKDIYSAIPSPRNAGFAAKNCGNFRSRVEARRKAGLGNTPLRERPMMVSESFFPYAKPIPTPDLTFLKGIPHLNRFFGISRHGSIISLNPQMIPVAATSIVATSLFQQATPLTVDATYQGNIIANHSMRVVKVWGSPNGSMNPMRLPLLFEYACEDLLTSLHAIPNSHLSGMVVTGEAKGGIKIWNLCQNNLNEFRWGDSIAALRSVHTDYYRPNDRHSDTVTALHTDPQIHSNHLFSGDISGTLCVNDLERQVLLQRYQQPSGGILSMSSAAATERGNLVVTVGFHPDPLLWDVRTKQATPIRLRDAVHPHLTKVPFVVAPMSQANGSKVMTCDAKARFKVWDTRMLRCLETIDLPPQHMHRNSDESAITSATPFLNCADRVALTASGNLLLVATEAHSSPRSCFSTPANGLCFDKESSRIFTCHDNAVVIWEGGSGVLSTVHRPKFHINLNVQRVKQAYRRVESSNQLGTEETIRCLVISSRKHFYVVGTSWGRVAKIKTISGEVIMDLGRIHPCEVRTILIGYLANNSEIIVSLGIDGVLKTLTRSIECVCFVKEESGLVAIGTSGGLIGVLSLYNSEGQPNMIFETSVGGDSEEVSVRSIAFIEPLQLLAAALTDGFLALIRSDSGVLLRRIQIQPNGVPLSLVQAALRKEGASVRFGLVVLDDNGVASVGFVTRSILHTPLGSSAFVVTNTTANLHSQAAHCLAVRDDGYCFVTASPDGTAKVTRTDDIVECGMLCHGRRHERDHLARRTLSARAVDLQASIGQVLRQKNASESKCIQDVQTQSLPPFKCEVAPHTYFRSVQRSYNVLRRVHQFANILRERVRSRLPKDKFQPVLQKTPTVGDYIFEGTRPFHENVISGNIAVAANPRKNFRSNSMGVQRPTQRIGSLFDDPLKGRLGQELMSSLRPSSDVTPRAPRAPLARPSSARPVPRR